MSPIQFPKGKYVGMVKVGEKGQIVIPKGARDLFSIQPGDQLLLMADVTQGIALLPTEALDAPTSLFSFGKEAHEHDDLEGGEAL